MVCSGKACNWKIEQRINELQEEGDFPRAKVMRNLQRGGTIYYAAAPELIPPSVTSAKTLYGDTYEVLHLYLKECSDGTLIDNVDWEGVHGGKTYLESRGFFKVKVSTRRVAEDGTIYEQPEITAKEAANPVSMLMNTGVVTVEPLGRMDAMLEWRAGQVRRAHYHDENTEALDQELVEKADTFVVHEDVQTTLQKAAAQDVSEDELKVAMAWLITNFASLLAKTAPTTPNDSSGEASD
jgi:hypothetical protein